MWTLTWLTVTGDVVSFCTRMAPASTPDARQAVVHPSKVVFGDPAQGFGKLAMERRALSA
jgi:hypothetical protein